MKKRGLRLEKNGYTDLGFAKADWSRAARQGFPEVIFGESKTCVQIAAIAEELRRKNEGLPVLVTRIGESVANELLNKWKTDARWFPDAHILVLGDRPKSISKKWVGVVSAGTGDMSVAEEAAVTAEHLGLSVRRIYDVGVAGLHRLLDRVPFLRKASALIVVAGMDGALPSVVGGLVACPVIAVPTSVGYGANFQGLSALLSMLNSCASGVTVVNIGNGFGAACAAHRILKTGTFYEKEKRQQ